VGGRLYPFSKGAQDKENWTIIIKTCRYDSASNGASDEGQDETFAGRSRLRGS
jgi:hypothetical protein